MSTSYSSNVCQCTPSWNSPPNKSVRHVGPWIRRVTQPCASLPGVVGVANGFGHPRHTTSHLASERSGHVCAATVCSVRAFRCVSAHSGTPGKWVQDPRDMFQPRLCTQSRRSAKSLIPTNPKGHKKAHGGELVGKLP
jgi:hypothetical protein